MKHKDMPRLRNTLPSVFHIPPITHNNNNNHHPNSNSNSNNNNSNTNKINESGDKDRVSTREEEVNNHKNNNTNSNTNNTNNSRSNSNSINSMFTSPEEEREFFQLHSFTVEPQMLALFQPILSNDINNNNPSTSTPMLKAVPIYLD